MSVLFVCVENSCRSQMAEAFARLLADPALRVCSAGTQPSGSVNPKAIRAMAELGYDLGQHRSKSLDEYQGESFDYVITMGCGDACPSTLGRHREDWALPDPKDLPPAEFNGLRDEIRRRVSELLSRD